MRPLSPNTVNAIFKRFEQATPSPTTELVYHSPFELLIAVMLSAQSTDISVNKVTGPLFAVANTPQKIAALGLENLKKIFKDLKFISNQS